MLPLRDSEEHEPRAIPERWPYFKISGGSFFGGSAFGSWLRDIISSRLAA
jgi:hypothetical protein